MQICAMCGLHTLKTCTNFSDNASVYHTGEKT